MNRCIRFAAVSAALAAGFAASDILAEEAAQAAPAAAEETPAEKPKKKPKKDPKGYTNWEKAVEVAEAYEQPIVAFLELAGDKKSSRIKLNAFGKKEFLDDFLSPNAVYYTYKVQPVKEKQQRGQRRDKNAVPKPDMTAIKESEKMIVTRIATGGEAPAWGAPTATVPAIAVLTPAGKLVALVGYDEEGAVLGNLVSSLKSTIEGAKYTCEVGKKLQKLIDQEAKKVADLEKRQRK